MRQTFKMIKNNILSIIVALIILYLSFANPETLNKVSVFHFRGLDKIIHLLMYFVFMVTILYEHRKQLIRSSQYFFIAIIPIVFGALIELFQTWFTNTRSGSIFDLLFNMAGILIAILIFVYIRRLVKENIR